MRSERYPSGDLLRLAADLTVGADARERSAELAINAPLDLGSDRLYVSAVHGLAALLEVSLGGEPDRRLVLLREGEGDAFEASAVYADGLRIHLRGRLEQDDDLPAGLEVRAQRQGTLLFVGKLGTSREVQLANGGRLRLHGIRRWAVFQGTRDHSRPIAYLGFLLTGLGAVLMFTVVKVDTAVVVEPAEGGERVLVALRAHCLAPVFAERFEKLAREHLGGPPV